MNRIEQGIISCVALVVAAAFTGVALFFDLAQIHPYRPRTGTGWSLLVAAPLLVLGSLSLIARVVEQDPFARWLATHGRNGSGWRTALYLPIRTVFVLGVLLLAMWYAVAQSPAMQSFIEQHFGPGV
jgi:hypothetical protein